LSTNLSAYLSKSILPTKLTMKNFSLTLLFCFHFISASSQNYSLKKSDIGIKAHFRALSVVDDHVAWLAGTGAQVGITTDGGKSWAFTAVPVPGFEDAKVDFRSLYAFDAQRAIIANVGSPATIFLTTDGGKTWKSVYTNSHADAFFDGIDFWDDKEGLIYGDPIDGKMLMLRTVDGGSTWQEVAGAPTLEKGEASFAASGTGLHCLPKDNVLICTGGIVSRLWKSEDRGDHWKSITVPMLQGESMTGIFSCTQNKNTLHIVGGNYGKEEPSTVHHYYSVDGGAHWLTSSPPVSGFRECVEPVSKKILLATGPTGSDVSFDNGRSWKSISTEKGLHVVRKARKGSLILAAGSAGAVYVVDSKP